jgi:hypothetical protein
MDTGTGAGRMSKRKGTNIKNAAEPGYSEADTPPETEVERFARERQQAKMNAGPEPIGPVSYHQPEGSPRLRVSGLTYEEAAEWFRTGVLP